MDGLVDQRPAAFRGPAALPGGFLIIGLGPVPGDEGADAAERPVLPALNHAVHQPDAGVVAVLETDADRDEGGGLQDQLPSLLIDGRGLFREHGDAPFCRFHRHQGVQVVRRAQVHGVQVFFFQHLRKVRVSGAAVSGRPLRNQIGAGGELGVFQLLEGPGVHGGDVAAADDPNSVHKRFLRP